ncbi:cobalamin biosynthesis protein CbiB [Hydrogenophaga crassostreae]|uniref:Cobalamin biosynthesis protein CobD n=1 Tax=Hydrogenophaga crassostreae TaxID=1763535 RepID=A0A163C7S4_9BURK|nr:CobD/CbiB family protein [Hydrogenophaga crassostreae]AOW12773.1 cobalamin biosynthesis protein CbiB [Hydrogenophaga crassostreae]OAD39961.1 cobalamin biosynthesis protein CbiB [Hydrogenophaga crassostreae]
MSFFAILIALLLEQTRPLAFDNPVHGALRSWARWVRRNLDAGEPAQGWLAWLLAAGMPAVLSALVYWGLWRFSTVLAFVWLVAVLYVTVGFRQFSHHFTDIRQALEAGDERGAREKLATWLRVDAASLPRAELLRQVIEQAVLAAHRHVFGVLTCFGVFWVLGLGPFGAIFYRMVEYLARNWRERPDGTPSTAMQKAAKQGWNVVDFVPARVTALGFAIVGNFEESVATWRGEAERFAPGNDGVLLAATSGALGVRLSQTVAADDADSSVEGGVFDGAARTEPQISHLASAVGLVWRSVVLWMLLLVLLTLARWQG